jgi:hypothetical protein
MATLKNMTRVGADVRQIARLLQAKAPENHMLAYITPEEAQLLRNRGGSGMPDPQTGVPSFAPVSEYRDTYDYGNVTQEPAQELSSQPVASVEAQALFKKMYQLFLKIISAWVKPHMVCNQEYDLLLNHIQKVKAFKEALIFCTQHHSFQQLLVFLNQKRLKLLKFLKI